MKLVNRTFLVELQENEIEIIHEALNNAFACEHSTQKNERNVVELRNKFVNFVDKVYLSGEAIKKED